MGIVLLPTSVRPEVTQVAEDVRRAVPYRFCVASVQCRAAEVQEESTACRALRQAQAFPWHSTTGLAVNADINRGRSGPTP